MEDRFKGLDALRLAAVLAVLLFHYSYRGALGQEGFTALSVPDWQGVARYGDLGVFAFFAISGVVIARSTEGRGPLAFLVARFTRIYPAFVVCMTLTFAATRLFGAPEFTAGAGTWAANLLVFAPALHRPFMDGAYWSIVYELVFYGWVALLLNRRIFERHGTAVALCWIALSAGNEILGPSGALRRLFLTDASGFFLCGITLYRLRAGGRSLRNGVVLALSAELAAGQTAIAERYNALHFGAGASNGVAIGVALGAVLLVGLCLHLRRDVLPARTAATVGAATYPLYLLHQNIGYIAFDRLGTRLPPKLAVAAVAVAMALAALAVHVAAERPLQRRLRRRLTAEGVARLRRACSGRGPPEVHSPAQSGVGRGGGAGCWSR